MELKWREGMEWPKGGETEPGHLHIFRTSDGWFFIDETESACLGPWPTLAVAQLEMREYAETL